MVPEQTKVFMHSVSFGSHEVQIIAGRVQFLSLLYPNGEVNTTEGKRTIWNTSADPPDPLDPLDPVDPADQVS